MIKIKKTKNMKKVLSDSTVTVNYTGRLEDGTIFDSSTVEGREPMTTKLGQGQLIKGFEEGLVDMSEGDKKTVEIESAEAYGEYLDYLIQEVEKSQMPGEVEVGMPLQAQTEMGVLYSRCYTGPKPYHILFLIIVSCISSISLSDIITSFIVT